LAVSEEAEKEKEKKKRKPRIWVREWRVEPGEWRPATPEEEKEFLESPWLDIYRFHERMRRFFKKLEEAFSELFG